MTDKTVANTILQQLGGNKFIAMTGAKNFYADDYLLGFKIGRNASGINHVKIFLNARDTYDITWMRIRGDKINVVKEDKGIYADQLQELFTERTGMYTHLNPLRNPDDKERAMWVNNDEPLYGWWKSTRKPLAKFIKENRAEIDGRIARVSHKNDEVTWRNIGGFNPSRRNPTGGGLFQKFHGANPTTRQVEFNPPKGKKLIKIGRIVSVVYEPEPPSKLSGKQFEHKWGDTGDKMLPHRPLFCTDISGKNFFIVNDKARPYFNERGVIG